MVKKSDIVRELVRRSNYKKALSITKGFRIGITKDQNDKMVRAYECMVGHDRLYAQLGFNIADTIQEGVDVLVGLYGEARSQ